MHSIRAHVPGGRLENFIKKNIHQEYFLKKNYEEKNSWNPMFISTYSTSRMLGSAYHPSKAQILQTTDRGNKGWTHFLNWQGSLKRPGPPYLIMSRQWRQVAQSGRIHAWQILHGIRTGFLTFSDLIGEYKLSLFRFILDFSLAKPFSFFIPGQWSKGCPVTDLSGSSFLWPVKKTNWWKIFQG